MLMIKFAKRIFDKKHTLILYYVYVVMIAHISLMADEMRNASLERSIISVSRVDTLIDEAPGNVSVIGEKHINIRPNYKFSDTIRGFEGLQQSKSRGMDTFDGIKIRGLSGAAIMVDGIVLNDINNNTKLITSMNANDIEQVEVVRGAFSNIYGSGAVAGAINFVTRMPTNFETNIMLGYGNAINTEFAPKNTFRGYVVIGDVFFDKKLRLKASLGIITSSGYAADSVIVSNVTGYDGAKLTLDSNTGDTRYNIGDMGQQSYSNYDANIRAEYDVTDMGVLSGYLRWNMYEYDHKNQQTFLRKDGLPSYGSNVDYNANDKRPTPIAYGENIGKEIFHQLISSIGYKHYLQQDSFLDMKFYRIDGWDRFNNPGGRGSDNINANTTIYGGDGTQTNHKYETNNFDIVYALTLDEKHRILAGMQYRHNNYTQNTNYIDNWKNFSANTVGRGTSAYSQGGKTDSVGLWGEWRANWLYKLNTSIGLRYDYWRGYDLYKDAESYTKNTKNLISPKLSINYALSDMNRIKTSFGQAFKSPTFSQMFSNRAYTDGTQIRGNPNLKPENVLSFDIGLEQDIPTIFGDVEHGVLKIYYFNNTTSNAIMQYSPSHSVESLRGYYDNLGKYRIQGIESSFIFPIGYGIGLHLTYTFMDSKILKSLETSTIGNKVAGVPAHLAYASLSYDGRLIFGSFGIEYASKPYKTATNIPTPSKVYGATDSYAIADVKMGLRMPKHFELSANITNLFNQTYYSYYRASGRAYFVSLKSKF